MCRQTSAMGVVPAQKTQQTLATRFADAQTALRTLGTRFADAQTALRTLAIRFADAQTALRTLAIRFADVQKALRTLAGVRVFWMISTRRFGAINTRMRPNHKRRFRGCAPCNRRSGTGGPPSLGNDQWPAYS